MYTEKKKKTKECLFDFFILPVTRNPTNALNEYFNYLLHNTFVSILKHWNHLISENTYALSEMQLYFRMHRLDFCPRMNNIPDEN